MDASARAILGWDEKSIDVFNRINRETEEKEEDEERGTFAPLSLVCHRQIEFLTSLYYAASEMSLIHSRFFFSSSCSTVARRSWRCLFNWISDWDLFSSHYVKSICSRSSLRQRQKAGRTRWSRQSSSCSILCLETPIQENEMRRRRKKAWHWVKNDENLFSTCSCLSTGCYC